MIIDFVILVCMFLGSVHVFRFSLESSGTVQILPSWALLSSDDFSSLYDVYDGLHVNENCRKTTYIMQFLWRDLTSDFDVKGPYFT